MKTKRSTAVGSPRWFLLGLALLFAYALVGHLTQVFAPFQIEYREGAVLHQIDGALRGLPVYDRALLPTYLNLYGSIYNSVGTTACRIFGESFITLRFVSFASIVASLLLFLDMLRRRQIPVSLQAVLALSLYAGLLFFTSPLARPDALGFLLYMSCLWLFEIFDASSWSMLLLISLSLLAFLTKQYFGIIGPMAILYVSLFRNMLRGLLFGLAYLALLLLTYRLDGALLPGYLPMTLAINSGATNALSFHSTLYMIRQTVTYLLLISGPLLACMSYKQHLRKALQSRRPEFAVFCSALILSLLTFKLGHHSGAFLTYYLQLLSPVLLLALALPSLGAEEKQRSPITWGVVLLLCAIAVLREVTPPLQTIQLGRNLRSLAADMEPYPRILASPLLEASVVDQGKEVFRSGQTYYMPGAYDRKALQLPGEQPQVYLTIETQYENKLLAMLSARQFDLVIRDDEDGFTQAWTEALQQNYKVSQRRLAGKRIETEWVPKLPQASRPESDGR